METELCQSPLHAGRIVLFWSVIFSTGAKIHNKQIRLQKFQHHHDHKYILALFVQHGMFLLNCASAAQLFRAKFCGNAEIWSSEMLICKQPGTYIIQPYVAHCCDCHCLQLWMWTHTCKNLQGTAEKTTAFVPRPFEETEESIPFLEQKHMLLCSYNKEPNLGLQIYRLVL